MLNTTQEVLDFMNNFAETKLEDSQNDPNSTSSREKYDQYVGMRELINAVIDEIGK